MLDFSLQMYVYFLSSINTLNYKITGVRNACKENHLDNIIILRHDVDRFPHRALAMAIEENRLGVQSTFYFRRKPFVYNPDIIKKISNLGHEIGYHYETLNDAKGDYQKAAKQFANNLEAFRSLVPVHTVAMHGRPFSPFAEISFWEKHALEEFGLEAEAYLSLRDRNILYLNDTGRTWDCYKHNFRDILLSNNTFSPTAYQKNGIRTTFDVMTLLSSRKHSQIYLSFHPERWPSSYGGWLFSLFMDIAVNCAKSLLRYRNAS